MKSSSNWFKINDFLVILAICTEAVFSLTGILFSWPRLLEYTSSSALDLIFVQNGISVACRGKLRSLLFVASQKILKGAMTCFIGFCFDSSRF